MSRYICHLIGYILILVVSSEAIAEKFLFVNGCGLKIDQDFSFRVDPSTGNMEAEVDLEGTDWECIVRKVPEISTSSSGKRFIWEDPETEALKSTIRELELVVDSLHAELDELGDYLVEDSARREEPRALVQLNEADMVSGLQYLYAGLALFSTEMLDLELDSYDQEQITEYFSEFWTEQTEFWRSELERNPNDSFAQEMITEIGKVYSQEGRFEEGH